MSSTLAALVLSYSRPRMLAEALASVAAAHAQTGVPHQVIVVDDGSDFDFRTLALGAGLPNVRVLGLPPMPPEERIRTPRVGTLVNAGLARVETDHVAYLCDDDLWAPEWPAAALAALEEYPLAHMVRGRWLVFRDGEPATRDNPLCRLDDRQMTTGNFAHRMQCFRQCGAGWPTHTVACHDNEMLEAWAIRHGGYGSVLDTGILAGWRRLHDFNGIHFATGNEYRPEALAWLSRGYLE